MDFTEEEIEEVLSIFQEESEEQLQKLNESLLTLEANPEDQQAIQTIFREAHSLKGAARMIGLSDIESISHKLEDIFSSVKKGTLEIKPELVDVICKAVDSIGSIIEKTIKTKGTHNVNVKEIIENLKLIEQGENNDLKSQKPHQKNIDADATKEENLPQKDNPEQEHFSEEEFKELQQIFFAESKSSIDSIFDGLKKLSQFPYDKEIISEVYRNSHTIEGAARLINLNELQNIAHVIRDIIEQAVNEELFVNSDVIATLEKHLNQLKTLIDNEYTKGDFNKDLNLEQMEKQIEAKMQIYQKKDLKPKIKTPKQKISLSSDDLDVDQDEILADFGVVKKEIEENSETQKPKIANLDNFDPLSLSDEELGNLEIGSLKGIMPIQMPDQTIEKEQDLPISKSFSQCYQTDSNYQDSESIDSILDSLYKDFNLLSDNINNQTILSKVNNNIKKVETLIEKTDQKELLAIISKIVEILSELNEEKILLNNDMAVVIAQSIESSLTLLTKPEDLAEDPSLIYQRLTILHQAARLSSGIPFITEPETFHPQSPKTDNNIPEINNNRKEQNETKEDIEPIISTDPNKLADFSNPLETIKENLKPLSSLFAPKTNMAPMGEMALQDETLAREITDTYTIKTLRVDTRKLDHLVAQVGELIIAKIKAKERLNDVEKILNLLDGWQRDWAKNKHAIKGADKKNLKSAFMPEGTSIYTPGKDMQAIVRENYDMIAQLTNQLNLLYYNIQEDDTRLSLIINELEERIKNVRLLPLATIFNMFPRMVRDIARQQNKEIELEIRGMETTVDKKIIEEIKSPLMHIIRNAIDHGIEPPQDRLQKSKNPIGKIILSARHLENSVLIEIIDDGRGVDLEAVKSKVLEKELLTPAEIAAMSETQIMNIIFWPGFSTGSEITDISGRGVGMDIVHNKITQLNGKVRVRSKLGESCCVSIQLPVTMATIQVFLVNIHNQTYAIPASVIKTAILIKPEDIFFKEGRQTILVDNIPVFLCNLGNLLELPSPKDETTIKDKITVLVLQTEDVNIGFIVDGLLGDQEILHKNLEPPFIRVRNVAGVTTLGSGEVCLILNAGDLIKTAQMNYSMALKSTMLSKENSSKKKDILVVDDSVTTRILERNILRAAGYNVTVAVNGLDALTKLAIQHFDLIVSDVEMPDITGIELVSRLKRDDMLSKIPVILVTSLASETDKQKGYAAGASAYITKGSFDQEELLNTIKKYI